MARVTVIIPAFNPGELLRRALESVSVQTFTDLEVVVIDDGGSQDLSWVESADRAGRIRLTQQPNLGVSAARNAGAATASGEFLAFLDADDAWMPTKLEKQIAAMDRNPASVCFTDFIWRLRDGSTVQHVLEEPVSYEGLLDNQFISGSSILVRTRDFWVAGGYNPALHTQEDFDLYLRISILGGKFIRVPEVLTWYYLHAANSTLNYLDAYASHMWVLELHRRRATLRGEASAKAAIHRGARRVRELYGTQAFDAFRCTHDLKHLRIAARLAPHYTFSSVARKVLGQSRTRTR
jgi:glycosyltransferase involved in cell wall biosynthesis